MVMELQDANENASEEARSTSILLYRMVDSVIVKVVSTELAFMEEQNAMAVVVLIATMCMRLKLLKLKNNSVTAR